MSSPLWAPGRRFTNETTNPTTGSTSIAEVTFNLRYPRRFYDKESDPGYGSECARGCRDRRARQGVRTRRTVVRKDEQRNLARRARCHRVHSARNARQGVMVRARLGAHRA